MKQTMDRPGRMDINTVNMDSLPMSNLRSEEELRKYTLDENLETKPIEKALYLLSNGDEIQKISVISSLTELYKTDSMACLNKIVPKIQQNLVGSTTEYHLSYCSAVQALLDERIIPMDNFSSVFLQTILTSIEHRDSQVVDAWVDCLVNLIAILPLAILMKEVKPFAISKASPTKPVHIRSESCRIIGALCKRLPSTEVDKELIPVIMPLWRDPSPDVRSAMIQQLQYVVKAIGVASETEYIIGPFVQLVSDELPKVAEVAFAAMVESIPYFTIDSLRESIWPLLREIIIQAFKFDYNLLLVVAKKYGKMVSGLERAIPASEKEIYVKHYISLMEKASDKMQRGGRSRMGPELCAACRKCCASNYKDMAKFAYNENNKALLDQLHPVLNELISDHYWECRKTIAASMFDIVIIYGKYNFLLKKQVNNILRDNLVEVIDGMTPRLAEILVTFYRAGYYTKDQADPNSSDLLKALDRCENTLVNGNNWRSYCKFINQLEVMWYIFSPDVIYNKFVDLFFKRLNYCKVLQSRLVLLRSLLINLKYIPRAFYKAEAKNKVLDFSTSPNFYDRMLFLRSVDILLDVNSTAFFKDHYFLRTIQMTEDAVPNIRWTVCSLLPKLHSMIKLPDDKVLMDVLEDALQTLNSDKDKEIQDMVRKVRAEIETSPQYSFPNEQKNLEEERLLENLIPKQVHGFPESIITLLHPTVMGISVVQRESSVIERLEISQLPTASRSRSGSSSSVRSAKSLPGSGSSTSTGNSARGSSGRQGTKRR